MKELFIKLSKQKKFLENKGYNVVYIGLYGSQNYNLDDKDSDVDCRTIVIPKLEDIIQRKTISKKYSNEIGDIDVKDLVTYYDVVSKGNFSFIEPLQTKYFIGDKEIRKMFSTIKLNLKSVKGAMLEKAKAFQHRYPSKKEEFEKWGYDPKQLHHIFRLLDLLKLGDETEGFIYYDDYDDFRSYLLDVKRNENDIIDTDMDFLGSKTFEELKEYINGEIKRLALIPNDYKYEKQDLSKEVSNYLIKKFKYEMFNNEIGFARQVRTFGGDIPKSDIKKFPQLEKHKGKDLAYTVYESIEIDVFE